MFRDTAHLRTWAYRKVTGFSLVELAIVLVILGLLLGTVIRPLTAQMDQRAYRTTEQQIAEVREALLGFAIANGRLPRPATSATDGAERPTACASELACTGVVPWSTLGVGRVDAWNKLLRYSVTPAFADSLITLGTNATKKIQTRDVHGSIAYLVGSASACSASSPCAPAVIYSAGKNNWGTTDAGVPVADESATNADEDHNETANTVFFSRDWSPGGLGGGEFDDVVSWIPFYVLANRMVAAGRLP